MNDASKFSLSSPSLNGVGDNASTTSSRSGAYEYGQGKAISDRAFRRIPPGREAGSCASESSSISSGPKKNPHVTSKLADLKQRQSSSTLAASGEEKPLPKDFKPSEFTVIIGRGKKIRESIGNTHLRILATTYLPKYAEAMNNRQAKTDVVNNIMDIIRAVCPGEGAFARCEQGQWYEVSDRVAREKIGYVLRDLLADQYESSCKSKTAKRKRLQALEKQQKQLHEQEKFQMSSSDGSISSQQDFANLEPIMFPVPSADMGSTGMDPVSAFPGQAASSFSDFDTMISGQSNVFQNSNRFEMLSQSGNNMMTVAQPNLQQNDSIVMQQQLYYQQQLRRQQQQLLVQQQESLPVYPMSTSVMGNRVSSSALNRFNAAGFAGPPRSPCRSSYASDYSSAASNASSAWDRDDSARSQSSLSHASNYDDRQFSQQEFDFDFSDLLTSPLMDCRIENNDDLSQNRFG
jgi:hypothetical protein